MSKSVGPVILLWACLEVSAQVYLGPSVNIGNRLSYTSSKGFRRPVFPSPGLNLFINKNLQRDWALQYGVAAGAIGYNLKVRIPQPNGEEELYGFPTISTLYGSLDVTAGKKIPLGNRQIFVGLGGGATYYYTPSIYMGYGVYEMEGSLSVRKFSADVEGFNRMIGFARISLQYPLNKFMLAGVSYSHHFGTVIRGEYQFENVRESSAGSISLRLSELNLVLMFNLSRIRITIDRSE